MTQKRMVLLRCSRWEKGLFHSRFFTKVWKSAPAVPVVENLPGVENLGLKNSSLENDFSAPEKSTEKAGQDFIKKAKRQGNAPKLPERSGFDYGRYNRVFPVSVENSVENVENHVGKPAAFLCLPWKTQWKR